MATDKSTEEETGILEKILSRAMSFNGDNSALAELEEFLSKHAIASRITEEVHRDPEEFKRLRSQNLLMSYAESFVDQHLCSEIREIAEPVRAVIWKCAGIQCDDFSKLHIGKWVRFFNPKNITIVTGGHPVYFAGLRSSTFIDGRAQVVIFAPADFAAGAKIFTHLHIMDNPNISHLEQGRVLIPSTIYPDCSIGEDTHIFGNLALKTILADVSVTSHRKLFPPYSIVGGVGDTLRVIRYLDFPDPFPPRHLEQLMENAKKSFPDLGRLLQDHYKIVKELVETKGDRKENWSYLVDKEKEIEKKYLRYDEG